MKFDFDIFVAEWQLSKDATKTLQAENFTTKPALLHLSEDDPSDPQLKKGDRAAVCLALAVVTLQKQFGSSPLEAGAAPTVKQETPAARLAAATNAHSYNAAPGDGKDGLRPTHIPQTRG